MSIGLRVSSLTFSGSDQSIDVGSSDLVILIGPNNVGKSRALREIEQFIGIGQPDGVITAASADRTGSADDLEAWLRRTTSLYPTQPGQQEHRSLSGGRMLAMSAARQLWEHGGALQDLTGAIVFRADAEQRLGLAGSVASVDILGGQGVEPLQRLIDDHDAEERLSQAVLHAFGVPVHVNRAGGSQLHLHLGRPAAEPRLNSPDYQAELRALPLVANQGDGMRSFIGLLLALSATPYPLVLIDEPEAFLHPPQARELGRQLARADAGQRVVATHSADVLLGMLDVESPTTIVRLQRDGDRNVPSVLKSDQIRSLWHDPSLRYSNLLDGLFHSGVVITEDDGDARLYSAALDAALAAAQSPSTDLLFTRCGGKQGFPKAISALVPLGVPVAVVADVDVLRERELLERVIDGLGGSWSPFERDWNVVERAVRQHPVPSPAVGEVRRQILEVLGDEGAVPLNEAQSDRIRRITTSQDGWKAIRKAGGISAFPRGQANEAGRRLIADLRRIGLFVVPVGDLEGWAPGLGAHGRRFVDRALTAGVHASDGPLQAFVKDIAAFLASGGAGA